MEMFGEPTPLFVGERRCSHDVKPDTKTEKLVLQRPLTFDDYKVKTTGYRAYVSQSINLDQNSGSLSQRIALGTIPHSMMCSKTLTTLDDSKDKAYSYS
jgi:hypothetical protein